MPFERIRPARYAGSDPQERLDYLRRQVKRCDNCPNLVKSRGQTVFGEGPADAALMLVGEAPGADEDYWGRPFVGKAGKLLDRMLREAEFRRDDVYIANVLKCRPDAPQGNRTPSKPEMDDCLPFLYAQIEVVDPPIIVAMGSTAISALGSNLSMTEARGQEWLFRRNWPVIGTWHPAYVLRNPEARHQFVNDIVDAAAIVGV